MPTVCSVSAFSAKQAELPASATKSLSVSHTLPRQRIGGCLLVYGKVIEVAARDLGQGSSAHQSRGSIAGEAPQRSLRKCEDGVRRSLKKAKHF